MTIDELIQKIENSFSKKEYNRFITQINFPKFKNFSEGLSIDILFPISVITGSNGGGKSSILHAIWGMPQGYSTSRFWFSTHVDHIKEQNKYWYKHYIQEIDMYAECRKISGNKRHGYWEPARPVQSEGMAKIPSDLSTQQLKYISSSKDRWNQVDKKPLYINTKAESNAFERIFYDIDTDLEKRQKDFIKSSKNLAQIIDENLTKFMYYKINRLFKNKSISMGSLNIINDILGKKYKSAQFVKHDLYGKLKASSVIFEIENQRYSECFAGSGELAVVNIVLALENINQHDMILLDEPETSLHPGAQRKLLQYLLKICHEKKAQIFMATHSHIFVDLLPEKALIVLDQDNDKVIVRKNPTKVSAFYTLGLPPSNKITLLAEDTLLASFVEISLSLLPPESKRLVNVESATVGASEMLSNQVKAYALAKSKVIMIIDGDMSDLKNIFNIDINDISRKKEEEYIDKLEKMNISVGKGGLFFKEWCNWCANNVLFIKVVCPEKILIKLLDPQNQHLSDDNYSNQKWKELLKYKLRKMGIENNPKSQTALLKLKLHELPDKDNFIKEFIDIEDLHNKITRISRNAS